MRLLYWFVLNEVPLHYLQCEKCPNVAETNHHAVKDIKRWLARNETAPALITSVVTRIMYKFMQRQQSDLDEWSVQNKHNSSQLDKLISEQKNIDWSIFFKGRISRQWSNIQSRHYESPDLPASQAYKTGKWWASNLMRQVIYFSLNAWQIRNDVLHKDRLESNYEAERGKLRTHVRLWYSKAHKFSWKMQQIF